ncbi:MAG: hypothetical protein R3F20_11275 [Planctomycetota bacterium]
MNDSPFGPFKAFSILWFPFALPAIACGVAGWIVFYLANVLFAASFDGVESAAQAIGYFGVNARRAVLGLDFSPAADTGTALMFALQGAVVLVLWSTFGLSTCRVMALRLAREEYIGYRDSLAFGFRHARSVLLFPFIVGAIVAVLWGIQAALGLLPQWPGTGILAVIVLPLSYALTFASVAIVLSSLFAMGMLPAAIAVERKGTLDAWGKALNYLFARPLHVILYLVLLKVFLVDIVVHYAFEVDVLHRWTERALTSWRDDAHYREVSRGLGDLGGYDAFCAWIHRGIRALIDLFVVGFALSCFFAAFTGMFLIFRRDVDGIDVGDIDVESDSRRDPAPRPVPPPSA